MLLAPLLPFSLGIRPRPSGAVCSMLFLLVLGFIDLGVNALTGGNYLFLEAPASGTPLAWMARRGVSAYRLMLAGATLLVLGAEALAVWLAERKHPR